MSIEKRIINVHGNTFSCLVAGDPQKPAIVMVHGWAHHPDIWRTTMEVYQDRYFCVAVGLLGMGESSKPANGDYRIEAHARDTLAIVDALNIDRFILMGQSRGGQIALCLASQVAPERVLQLVDIAGVVTGRLSNYMMWLMRPLMWLNRLSPLMNRFGRQVFQHDLIRSLFYAPYFADIRKVPPEAVTRDFVGALQPTARLTHYRCMQTMISTNLVPHLHHIRASTLIIFGQQDGCVPPKQGDIAHQYIRNSQLVLLPHCGHYPMVECPTAYFAALDSFLLE